jgi:hypothetical protein
MQIPCQHILLQFIVLDLQMQAEDQLIRLADKQSIVKYQNVIIIDCVLVFVA